MKTLPGLAMLALLAGCKVAATAEDFRWKVNAPASVSEESKLHFTVETHQRGVAVNRVPYVWKVLWAGVEGIRHQGHSFERESIRVKGGPGTATLLILAIGPGDHLSEVARATVRVVAAPPPAG